MASVIIDKYAVWIKPGRNYYKVGLRAKNGGTVYQPNLSGPEELMAIVDLLRNEDTCWYDPDANRFTVGFEPVGEGES